MASDHKSNHLNSDRNPSPHDYVISLHDMLAFLILACNRISNLEYCKILHIRFKNIIKLERLTALLNECCFQQTQSTLVQHGLKPACLISHSWPIHSGRFREGGTMTPIAIMSISSKQRRNKCLLWSNCDLGVPAPPQSPCIEMECKTTLFVFHLFKLEVNFQFYNQIKVKAKVTDGIRGKINH